ncbi:MAG: hypothetical protein ACFFA3_21725 [Promethearchaeota archaeon]
MKRFKNKKNLITSFITAVLIVFSMFPFFPVTIKLIPSEDFPRDLRASQYDVSGEIAIKTPENKIYTEPMSGYYPATYGFENVNGSDDPEWHDVASQDAQIILELDGHKKIYEAIDLSSGGAVDVLNYYENQTYGTVEFWCRFTSSWEGHFYRLRQEGVGFGPLFAVEKNEFWYEDNSGLHHISSGLKPRLNTWYHIRFDFRGSSVDKYNHLTSKYSYYIYINSLRFGPYKYRDNVDIGTFHVHTSVLDDDFTIYWDAVGYSWDPYYTIGDNLNEGLLLSYENTINVSLDWFGYSLDGTADKTISGNTTIPMPNNGNHSIQVTANHSSYPYILYKSVPRHFTVFRIKIYSPLDSEFFGSSAPVYDLGMGDLYDTIWYTLDGGFTNVTASGLTGTIDQTEWDKFSDGIVTITFYANTSGGLVVNAEVTVIKHVTGGQISGYNIITLIGITCVISLLILKKIRH